MVGTKIACHDEYGLAKCCEPALSVCQSSLIHDLQQYIQNPGMGLLYFVEEYNRIWTLPHELS